MLLARLYKITSLVRNSSFTKSNSVSLRRYQHFQNSAVFLGIFCNSSKTRGFTQFATPRRLIGMSTGTGQIDRLEQNAQIAENLVAEIYSKLSDIEKQSNANDGIETPELTRLRLENENLRLEVAKWKELLLVREIRNGRNPQVTNPREAGKTVDSKTAKGPQKAPKQDKGRDASKGSGKGVTPVPSSKTLKMTQSAVNAPVTTALSTTSVKAEKKPKANNETGTPPAPAAGEGVDVSKLDFRIGLITECDTHPDADTLYVEKIDLGEEKPRTIISGLVKHVPIEEMRNRLVVVLANLKPAKMRGILSEGMVMCASSPEKVEILIPPEGSAPGDLVEVEGFPRAPEPQLNPKKKIFEAVQPDLKTNDKREATYKDRLWTVPGKGPILSSTLVHTQIK